MSENKVDKEMIKNLELLMSLDVVDEEPNWDSLEVLDNLEEADLDLENESRNKTEIEAQDKNSKKEVKK